MFKIIEKTLSEDGKITVIELICKETKVKAQILSGFGAALNSYTLNDLQFVEGYKDEVELKETHPDRSCGAILFPFSNRLNKGEYSFEEKDYVLPINFKWQPHAIHGLLAKKNFNLAQKTITNDSATIVLSYIYNAEENGFPFDFKIDVKWSLDLDNNLSCQTKVSNIGDKTFPYSLGWHPYFTLNNAPVEDYQLAIPSKYLILNDDLDLPTGEVVADNTFNHGKTIGSDFIDKCWELQSSNKSTQISLSSNSCSNSLVLEQDFSNETYKYFQAYTPPSRRAIALEPITSTANVFNHKNGLLVLEPGKEKAFNWKITIKQNH